MKLGFIGLGKMGTRMAEKLLKEGHSVVAWNRSKDVMEQFHALMKDQHIDTKLALSFSVSSLVEGLSQPRIIWSMLPAGEPTNMIMKEVFEFVEAGDIVIDGGNAHFKDTEKRYEEFKAKNVRFLGIGVSGGIVAAQNGYPLMVGGDKSAYEEVKPLLDSLSKPNGGHEYFGIGGAGHFVKMIHNGIEYGIMQSLAEGFDVMANAPYKLDLLKAAKGFQKGSLVSGFMLDRVVEVLEDDPKLEKIDGVIGSATGETVWTIEQAKEEGVPVEIIERSLEYRKRSQTDPTIQNSVTAKLVSGMRNAFGGHSIKRK